MLVPALVVALVGALLALAWVGGIAWNLWQVLRAREERAEIDRAVRAEIAARARGGPPSSSPASRRSVGFQPRPP